MDHRESEDNMDLTQVIIAQWHSQNQLSFNLRAYEDAALRREQHQSAARSAWSLAMAAILRFCEIAIGLSKLVKQRAAG